MKKATMIKMKSIYSVNSLSEIESLYIEGDGISGLYKKADVYDKIKSGYWEVFVNIPSYPKVQGAISSNGELYVKSIPNGIGQDNLLKLPKY